jgi:hypothetical protein
MQRQALPRPVSDEIRVFSKNNLRHVVPRDTNFWWQNEIRTRKTSIKGYDLMPESGRGAAMTPIATAVFVPAKFESQAAAFQPGAMRSSNFIPTQPGLRPLANQSNIAVMQQPIQQQYYRQPIQQPQQFAQQRQFVQQPQYQYAQQPQYQYAQKPAYIEPVVIQPRQSSFVAPAPTTFTAPAATRPAYYYHAPPPPPPPQPEAAVKQHRVRNKIRSTLQRLRGKVHQMHGAERAPIAAHEAHPITPGRYVAPPAKYSPVISRPIAASPSYQPAWTPVQQPISTVVETTTTRWVEPAGRAEPARWAEPTQRWEDTSRWQDTLRETRFAEPAQPVRQQPFLSQIRTFQRSGLRRTRVSPWPSSTLNEIKSFDRRNLRRRGMPAFERRAPLAAPFAWSRYFAPRQYFSRSVLPEIRSFNWNRLRAARPRPALPPRVRAAIRVYDKRLLRHVYPWSPYRSFAAFRPLLLEIRSFDRRRLYASRPSRQPAALLSAIRGFQRSRLRSRRIRSPWPQAVLAQIRSFNRRQLRSTGTRTSPRNWQLAALRRERKLPLEVSTAIHQAHAYPRLRPAPSLPTARPIFYRTPDTVVDMKRKSWPAPVLNEIRRFDKSSLHHQSWLPRSFHPFLSEVRSFRKSNLRRATTRVRREPIRVQDLASRQSFAPKSRPSFGIKKAPVEKPVVTREWYKSGVPYLRPVHSEQSSSYA